MNLISRLVYLVMLALTVGLLIGTVFASADHGRLAPHLRSSSVQPAAATAFAPRSL